MQVSSFELLLLAVVLFVANLNPLHLHVSTWQAEYCEIFSSFFSLDHVSVANESEVNVDEDAAIVFVFWLLKNLYLFFDF